MNRELIKNCLPCVIALTLTGLYSIIDGIFIGNCVGDKGLAAINIAWPIPATMTAAGIGIGTGTCVLYTAHMGQKKAEQARWCVCGGILCLVMVSLVIFVGTICFYPGILAVMGAKGEVLKLAKQYTRIIVWGCLLQTAGAGAMPILRGLGKPVSAMVISVLGMIMNLAANSYFLFVQNLGMTGVALGTVLSQGIVWILSLALMRKQLEKNSTKKLWRRSPQVIMAKIIRRILQLGIASFGTSLSATIVLIFTNWQCLKYGGDTAVAVYAAISYIVFPVQSVLQGIGEGVLPMISFAYGRNEMEEIALLRKKSQIIVGTISVVLAASVWMAQWGLADCFGLSVESHNLFQRGIRISCLAFLLLGYTRLNVSYLNGTQQVKKAVAFTYGESLIVSPLMLWLLPALMGTDGIWLSLAATAAIMLILYRYRKDEKVKIKWME